MKVGVLGLQGAVEEHVYMTARAMSSAGVPGEVEAVRTADDIADLDALIIPGGESTVMSKLEEHYSLFQGIMKKKLPLFGTCAGLILLSKKAVDKSVGKESARLLGLLDVSVDRNAYGRQSESFEAEVEIPALGRQKFRTVFIRAPVVKNTGKGVKVLARYKNKPILLQQGNVLASTFHPELTEDTRIHEYFLKSCVAKSGASGNP